eukprot:NODE_8260_length_1510_cov_3.263196.p1 GENE.NODE_8260_length_1510_cov_3.263196~~NODE_8260_length_1510_cov_3.263196.p1  ORF type:complete len:421 (-),score=82.28 NODE_8260_length_1510_cov_3.263196:142-1404(-)
MPITEKHMACAPMRAHTAFSFPNAGIDVKNFVCRLAATCVMPHYVTEGPPPPESRQLPDGCLTRSDDGDVVMQSASEPLHIALSSAVKPLVTERPANGGVVSGLFKELAAAFPSRGPDAVIKFLDAILEHEDELRVDKLEQHLHTNGWAFQVLASIDQEFVFFDVVRQLREDAERKLSLHHTLKVERFPKDANEDELRTEIMKHAHVQKLRISRDKVDDAGRCKILAFVEMSTIADAAHFVELCNERRVTMRAATTNWYLRAEWSKRGLADAPQRRHRRGVRGGRRQLRGKGNTDQPDTSQPTILPLPAPCRKFSLETPSPGLRSYAASASTTAGSTGDSPGPTGSASSADSEAPPFQNFAKVTHSMLPASAVYSLECGRGLGCTVVHPYDATNDGGYDQFGSHTESRTYLWDMAPTFLH